jgi:alpha-tubulin suppressor-like RCC1 family protein
MRVAFASIALLSLLVSACGAPASKPETPTTTSKPAASKGQTFRAARIAAGRDHACARTVDGKVACWGANRAGQLGDGTSQARNVATEVPGLAGVEEVAAGDVHSCARLGDGSLRCWGNNENGQLGDGTTTARPKPAVVIDIAGATTLAVGGSQSCAIKGNGLAYCWGEARESTSMKSPLPVFGLNEVKEVAVGGLHACARVPDGGVRCWGANNVRQLGVPRVVDKGMPVAVPELANAVQLSLGRDHSCARSADGEMLCWGGGLRCVPGEWSEGRVVAVKPAKIPGFEGVTSIAAGGDRACAVKKDGTVICAKARGNGAGPERACVAETIEGLTGVAELALGDGFGCARTTGGEVLCWGKNESGQLGNGSTVESAAPVSVVR